MKYRIKQINDEYCPQFKLFFFWHYYLESCVGYCGEAKSFSSIDSARDFLEKQSVIDNPKIKIHPYP